MRAQTMLIVALSAVASSCGVQRDLSAGRFACAQGGPCDGGPAGQDAGGTDAGGLDLSACVGDYAGVVSSGDLGTVEATLVDDGRMSFTFTTIGHPTKLTVSAQVNPDRTISSGAPSALIQGTFDEVRCAGSGTWTENGAPGGAWSLEKE